MSLSRYRAMRRFGETPEPSGGHAAHPKAPIFVVQLHHASHRHYDFRLEVDGVLKSWAVPKGPSFDPAIKRLAMQVEDHPIEYARFEGVIPEGNYGVGDVLIFDQGTWRSEDDVRRQLEKGHLHFSLFGTKLRGDWELVRTGAERGKPRWLLYKAKDEEAGPFESDDLLGDPASARRPTAIWRGSSRPTRLELPGVVTARIDAGFFEPELARRQTAPPTGAGWLHEPKWDGYRLLACVADGEVRLWSRNGIRWEERVPEIAQAVAGLGARALRLDGELIAIAKGRRSSPRADFNALQAALSCDADGEAHLAYVVFDLLHVDGNDLSACSLSDRKQVLSALLSREHDPILMEGRYTGGDGGKQLARALREGYEGLVSKRAAAPYRAGRSGDWVKCRARDAEELAVVGYTRPRGSRAGFGALITARPRPGGGWSYAGRVGTGMSDTVLAALKTRLARLVRKTPPVHEDSLVGPRANGDLRGVTWVEPELAVEVEYHGRGKGGLLRQPSVKGLRHDKSAADLDLLGDRAPAPQISHAERVVYPKLGLTKGDVVAYYQAVAPSILPELVRRPLAVVRCPEGAASSCFFQKHLGPGFASSVHGLRRGEANADDPYLWIEDEAGLLALAQMNVIELHAWGTRVGQLDRCDRLVLDLDPAEDVSWRRVVTAAGLLRRLLRKAGLVSFARVSGGKGLHVVVPLSPSAPWDEAKGFARELASGLARSRPEEFIDVATKQKRGGKIFVDYLRNGRGATSVVSYSLRRTPEATVALPVSWSELARMKGPRQHTLRSVLKRLRAQRRDPWAGIDSIAQALPRLKDR